jgi:hypothetical protein
MPSASEELARQRAESGGMAPKKPRARADRRDIRPDGTVEPPSVSRGEKTNLLGQLEALTKVAEEKLASGAPMVVLDGVTGKTEVLTADSAATTAEKEQAIFDKVALFLDPKLRGPVFTFALKERNKFFVGRFPVQNEMLDVQREATALGREVSNGDILIGIVGELLKAILGWYPLNSPDVQVFRAHINDPSKWPAFRENHWLETRDPYVQSDEIIPLWKAFAEWKLAVQPTQEEIRFYFSRVN